MLSAKTSLICMLLLITFTLTRAQRKVVDGHVASMNKPYVVYLIKADQSPVHYDAWICGGAIVNEWFVVTSAACVEDVHHMYVVAGYNKYVPMEKRQEDRCIQETKKKVTWVCVPKEYQLDYEKVDKWSYIDIAAVLVDQMFIFGDSIYTTLCSYSPAPIKINYDNRYQQPGIDVVVYGWGHTRIWRKPGDPVDYNQEMLNYASTVIHNKEDCKVAYSEVSGMGKVIDKYMICTLNPGNLNEKGDIVNDMKPLVNGCENLPGVMCPALPQTNYNARRDNAYKMFKPNITRRQGICQNDHGGPLVTWVGTHEVLIAVASVFRVTKDSTCTGPYLYTSTQCNSAFIDCIINFAHGDKTLKHQSDPYYKKLSEFCNAPPQERGFDTFARTISWTDHPDGPAANDYIHRPQMPLNYH